jgi:hypothetical protein
MSTAGQGIGRSSGTAYADAVGETSTLGENGLFVGRTGVGLGLG